MFFLQIDVRHRMGGDFLSLRGSVQQPPHGAKTNRHFGFSKPAIEFSKPGTENSKPAIERPKCRGVERVCGFSACAGSGG